ncbi:MAG: hypothetical protein AAFU41_10775 [Pseudomonadota bacterium]
MTSILALCAGASSALGCTVDASYGPTGGIRTLSCTGDQSGGIQYPTNQSLINTGPGLYALASQGFNVYNDNGGYATASLFDLTHAITTSNRPGVHFQTYAALHPPGSNPLGTELEVYLLANGGVNSISTTGNSAPGVRVNNRPFFALREFGLVTVEPSFGGSDLRVRIMDANGFGFNLNSEYQDALAGLRTFSINTSGSNSPGVIIRSEGSRGIDGSSDVFEGGSGGPGGWAGEIEGIFQGRITTTGFRSPGVLVQSIGAAGGNGDGATVVGTGGNGGSGGGSNYVSVINMANITTYGQYASGMVVQSLGGNGGVGGNSGFFGGSGGFGAGSGQGGDINITNAFWSTIRTHGSGSAGILAQSIGGFSGAGGSASGLIAFGGNSTSAGNGGFVQITNSGTIVTSGAQDASAIVAQTIGGGGGAGGYAGGAAAVGGYGSRGGDGGGIGIENYGTLNTSTGLQSHGILAQSIGGGGGSGGSSAGITALGGAGGVGGRGGSVFVLNRGAITTGGDGAFGIYAQSIGGGGGNGGNAVGVVSFGATGGSGGSSGAARVQHDGTIVTSGRDAIGIMAQSIGGGGGTGGSGTAFGANISAAFGGSGAGGGFGATARVSNTINPSASSSVTTYGLRSHGIMAQSVGGGGGKGGSALSVSAGAFVSASVAMGGAGGNGGYGGPALVTYRGNISTAGDAANGILAQSVGGGGGNGGYAISASASTNVSAAFGFGGAGGGGGGAFQTEVTHTGNITTTGQNSSAIVAQSIGGGGGNGGYAVSGAIGFTSMGVAFGSGGSAGSAGTGFVVDVSTNGAINTFGSLSHGVVAQSIGGGGGDGGYAIAASASATGAGSLSVGGAGGAGATSNTVTVSTAGSITTRGVQSSGVIAQSIGGGGGNGGFAIGGAFSGNAGAAIGLGGRGAAGSDSDRVTVINGATVQTGADGAAGIIAQSIGGGGGNGGFSVAGTFTAGFGASASFGGNGGSGGNSGKVPGTAVSVSSTGDVTTFGRNAGGILAQSIGGGGGNGGFSASGAFNATGGAGFSLGGSGSGGGLGRGVIVTSGGAITTSGDNSYGVLAQSIGGGGGNGGLAAAASGGGQFAGTLTVGGAGGTAASGGTVFVGNTGAVSTQGANADALVAQSIGGGGGNGGMALGASGSGGFAANAGFGGRGGGGGNAAAVTVSNTASLQTAGDLASGIVAQSIGGGGGNGGATIGAGAAARGSANMSFGGSGGAGGVGSTVTVTSSDDIRTGGMGASAILAQSVGGGGGNGGFSIAAGAASSANLGLSFGGLGGGGNSAGAVSVRQDGTTVTTGDNATAVIAQSIGGGGGNGGGSIAAGGAQNNAFLSFGGNGAFGANGSTVNATVDGIVETAGENAAGVLAQSVGGGGGNGGFSVGASGATNSASLSLGGSGASGGAGSTVTVTATADFMTLGAGANGITAQSIGGGGGNGGFTLLGAATAGRQLSVGLGSGGGAGGSGGAVTLSSTGSISTGADDSIGLLAQSIGGGGGRSGATGVLTGSGGPSLRANIGARSGSGGSSAGVTVNASDMITTFGNGSHGILAQSVGGGGGHAGGNFTLGGGQGATGALTLGASGGSGGASGTTAVTFDGQVMTAGIGAAGILAQSVSGGGGNANYVVGASGSNGFAGAVTLGAAGGAAGDAGAAEVTVTAGSSITTLGDSANAVTAQSLGGGGGNGSFVLGGAATRSNGLSLSLGGAGNSGGAAGAATVTADAMIFTSGNGSAGVVAESLAGGGGNAGLNISGGFATNRAFALALGASGGTGAAAGTANATVAGRIVTQGDNAIAIKARSVGGGGGNASVNLAAGVSLRSNGIAVSMGGLRDGSGAGGTGGVGGAVTVGSSTLIDTAGIGATGVLAQSIGGGGGTGAFSGSFVGSLSESASVNIARGGQGGSGNRSGVVTVSNTGTILTRGTDALGIDALSLGGGGGSGGGAMALTLNQDNEGHTIAMSQGGDGGIGGAAGEVTVTNEAAISTGGTRAEAIRVQSIGGGGGNGAVAATGTITASKKGEGEKQFSLSIGGSGGQGGAAGAATLINSGDLYTLAADSNGATVQSIGGGGGNGAMAVSLGFSGADSTNAGISLGGTGEMGGTGALARVDNEGAITTLGLRSRGIFAQSVGGGGGTGGMAGQFALGRGGDTSQYQISIGGNGGSGNIGGAVDVDHRGAILTGGAMAEGIFAQSVGGGGGAGGTAIALTRATTPATSASGDPARNTAVNVALGGDGGTGSHGGAVTTTINGSVITLGYASHGVFAQSVGGGGGAGGNAQAIALFAGTEDTNDPEGPQNKERSLVIGGDGGAAGDGGVVIVTNDGLVLTAGADAFGIIAQSVGGGGGIGGMGEHGRPSVDELIAIGGDLSASLPDLPSLPGGPGLPDVPGLPGLPGFPDIISLPDLPGLPGLPGLPSVGDLPDAPDLPGLPDGPDAPEAPEPPEVEQQDEEDGVSRMNLIVGGAGGAAGAGGTVTMTNTGEVVTLGDGAIAILAQSVGGGGGIGGYGALGEGGTFGLGGSGGAAGDGGAVSVQQDGTIVTAGTAAFGIFAQSVGGGGGIAGNVDRGVAANRADAVAFGASGGGGGNGADVTVDSTGTILTYGDGATAIVAQSVGGGGGLLGEIGEGRGLLGSSGAIGTAGQVTVTHTGSIVTYGAQAHGIYAQSLDGDGLSTGLVTVDYTGDITVLGEGSHAIVAHAKEGLGAAALDVTIQSGSTITGSAEGAALNLIGGDAATVLNQGTLQTIAGLQGKAIIGGDAADDVTNAHLIIGEVDLGGGANALTNGEEGTIIAGEQVLLEGPDDGMGYLENRGTLSVDQFGIRGVTEVAGAFAQTDTGLNYVDLDFADYTADLIRSSSAASWDGTLILGLHNVQDIRSGANDALFSVVEDEETGDIATDEGLELDVAPSLIASYAVTNPTARSLAVTATVDFTPDEVSLTDNQAEMGDHLNSARATAGSEALDPLVLDLFAETNPENFVVIYNSLSPEIYAFEKRRVMNGLFAFTSGLERCDATATDRCGWAETAQEETERTGNAALNDTAAKAEGLSLGYGQAVDFGGRVTFGLERTEESAEQLDGMGQISGNRFELGAAYSDVIADWTWSVGLSASSGEYDAERQLYDGSTAEGRMRTTALASHATIGRDFDVGAFSIAPSVSVGLGVVSSGAFEESGANLGLSLEDSSDGFALIAPGVAVGYAATLPNIAGLKAPVVSLSMGVKETIYLGENAATAVGGFTGSRDEADPFAVVDSGASSTTQFDAAIALQTQAGVDVGLTASRQQDGTSQTDNLSFFVGWSF